MFRKDTIYSIFSVNFCFVAINQMAMLMNRGFAVNNVDNNISLESQGFRFNPSPSHTIAQLVR